MKYIIIKLLAVYGPEFLTFLLEYVIGLLKDKPESTVEDQSVKEVQTIVERNTTPAIAGKVEELRQRYGK